MNLELLTEIDHGHNFVRLEDEVEDALRGVPIVLRRLQNSLRFAQHIGGDHHDPAALVRAAVSELVSIEGIQAEAGIVPPVRLSDSQNPLLHLVRELRNLELHLSSAEVASETRSFMWGRRDRPEDWQPVEHAIHWIDNLELERFRRLRNYPKYDPEEFAAALQWFDNAQRSWGITEMILRAANAYGEELAARVARQDSSRHAAPEGAG